MPWSIIASVGGALLGSDAADDAAGAQTAASEASIAEQRRQYDLTRADAIKQYNQVRTDQAPFRQTGVSAIQRLANGMGYPVQPAQQLTEAQIRAELTPQFTRGFTPQATQGQQQGLPEFVMPSRDWVNNPDNVGLLENLRAAGVFAGGQPQQSQQPQVDQAGLDAAVAARMNAQTPQVADTHGMGDFTKKFTLADYQEDPGYKFRLQQGEQGIRRAASARGGQYSGATLKALADFNSGLASQEYGNAYSRFNTDQTTQFNRNAALAGVGQTANTAIGNAGNATTGILANAGQETAGRIGKNLQDAGESRASGYVAQSKAIGSGIKQIYDNYQQNQALRRNYDSVPYNADAFIPMQPGGGY